MNGSLQGWNGQSAASSAFNSHNNNINNNNNSSGTSIPVLMMGQRESVVNQKDEAASFSEKDREGGRFGLWRLSTGWGGSIRGRIESSASIADTKNGILFVLLPDFGPPPFPVALDDVYSGGGVKL